MPAKQPAVTAADFLPEKLSLAALRRAAAGCRGCPLYKDATQTVFGEGRAKSLIMLVGEQPGDQEDQAGRPFVGPAGRLLDKLLAEAGIQRSQLYVTNAVKHFKFDQRGKRRMHKKPARSEVVSCRAWLESELAMVRPVVVVALGATAAQALIGPTATIGKLLGKVISTEECERLLVTYHPSALLRRISDPATEAQRAQVVSDLMHAAELARQARS